MKSHFIDSMGLPNAVLVEGSCTAKNGGLLDVLAGHGEGVIMVTDPPYTDVESTASTSKRRFSDGSVAISREIKYGVLTKRLRTTIAAATAVVEWSAIWDRPEGAYLWKRAIQKAGGVYLGMGAVLQTRGAPRLRGDGPGIRQLALVIARRKGKARWRGRPWAEWIETRTHGNGKKSVDRPIPGTRSIDCARAVIRDLADSCKKCGLVVDPCAGTGVIPQAARLEGLRALAFERDPETAAYCKRVLEGAGDDRGQSCLF